MSESAQDFEVPETSEFRCLTVAEASDMAANGVEIWGLLDTMDNCWFGDPTGPFLYANEIVAKLCAQLTATRMQWPLVRIRAVRYEFDIKGKRDEFTPTISLENAFRKLERGAV